MDDKRIYLYPGLGEGAPHYLDRIGTIKDLAESGITLSEGLKVGFYDLDANDDNKKDPLLFEGIVHFDRDKQKWYALIDWKSFRHESEINVSTFPYEACVKWLHGRSEQLKTLGLKIECKENCDSPRTLH